MSLPQERASRALDSLHWSARDLARILDVRDDSALKWLSGRLPLPAPILEWLELLAAFHDAHPRPPRPDIPSEKHALPASYTCPHCGAVTPVPLRLIL